MFDKKQGPVRKYSFAFVLVAVLLIVLLALGHPRIVEAAGKAGEDSAGQPKAFLTYDDGPSESTGPLLDVLAEYNVKATFFVTAQRDDSLHYIVIASESGHLVALHSYTHDYRDIYGSSDAFWSDIDELQQLITLLTHQPAKELRFPGGSSNSLARRYSGTRLMPELIEECYARGMTYHDWNLDTRDNLSGTLSAQSIFGNFKRAYGELKGQDLVILMHDAPNNTTVAEGSRLIIEFLLKEGYAFDTLDNIDTPVCHNLPD